MSTARDIAARMAKAINSDVVKADGSLEGVGITAYNTIDDVPSSGNQTGDLAFVKTGTQANRAYIWSGNGWRSVGLGSILSD